MDFNRIMKEKLVSESCETIKAKCGCITLKGVVVNAAADHRQMVPIPIVLTVERKWRIVRVLITIL